MILLKVEQTVSNTFNWTISIRDKGIPIADVNI